MNKLLAGILLLTCTTVFGQKKFPDFKYVSIQGDSISNTNLYGKTSLVIVGHISCPGMLFLLRDIQRAELDTIQVFLFLENTKEQILAFNSNDTNDTWGEQRHAFKISLLTIPTITACDKERIKRKSNGTIVIKNQCNRLKFKYHAFDTPTMYAVNNKGLIINKQTGWYMNSKDPSKAISDLFSTKTN